MANSTAAQVITVDSTGACSNQTKDVRLVGITIAPTNATWALTLTDAAGNIILALNNLSPAPALGSGKTFTGISCTVATAVKAYVWIN